jgi:hypothetical protein
MLHRSFVAHDQPPTVIHPPETAFDFPALAITRPRSDGTPAPRPAPPAFNGRNGRLDAPPGISANRVHGFERVNLQNPAEPKKQPGLFLK